MAGCAKDEESISAENSSVLMSEEGAVLDNSRDVTLNLEDFWNIETNEDNTVKFVTGKQTVFYCCSRSIYLQIDNGWNILNGFLKKFCYV